MCHFKLQVGASIVVPFKIARTHDGPRQAWRVRGLREIGSPTADSSRFGWGTLQVAGRRSAAVLSQAAARDCQVER